MSKFLPRSFKMFKIFEILKRFCQQQKFDSVQIIDLYFLPRQCEEFIFGGCRGNRNNFDSAAACASACAPQLRMAALTPFLGDPSAQETQRCKLGNESYAVGDMVRLNSDPCQVQTV